jgi:hypothetical protein
MTKQEENFVHPERVSSFVVVFYYLPLLVKTVVPIAVAARSKALTTFAGQNTGIVGSYPTRGTDVCALFCV